MITARQPRRQKKEKMYALLGIQKKTCATLSYSKTGNKKRATRFATLLQNELNTDVARFTNHVRTCLATNQVARFVFVGGKTHSIAIQLVLQQCCQKGCAFFCLFTVPFTAPPLLRQENENENENEDKGYDDNEHENGNENEDEDEKEYEYENENGDDDESENGKI